MDEDVAGLTRVVSKGAYGICARCGEPLQRPRVTARQPVRSGEEVLCASCYREAAKGEPPAESVEEE